MCKKKTIWILLWLWTTIGWISYYMKKNPNNAISKYYRDNKEIYKASFLKQCLLWKIKFYELKNKIKDKFNKEKWKKN